MYPRTVLLSYLELDRYRTQKLEKCQKEMNNEVIIGAMVNNIKKFVKEKNIYFKTGKCSNLIKSINTDNLNIMYRVLVVERNGLNDINILLSLYERGNERI